MNKSMNLDFLSYFTPNACLFCRLTPIQPFLHSHSWTFLGRSSNLTLKALRSAVLSKFKSAKHVPVWKQERPEKIRGDDGLKVHRIYPLGMTQRQALYTFTFKGDREFRNHIESNPCAKFEVIFV